MRYDDAKNCTFMPASGTRCPARYKRILRELYDWAPQFLDDEELSLNVYFNIFY